MKPAKCMSVLIAVIILFTSCVAITEQVQHNEEINSNIATEPAIMYDEELNVNYYTQSTDKALETMLQIMRSMYGDKYLFYKSSGSSYRIIELTSIIEYTEETKVEIQNALIFLSTVYKEALEEQGSNSNSYVMLLNSEDHERVMCSALNGEIDFSYLDYADEDIYNEAPKN